MKRLVLYAVSIYYLFACNNTSSERTNQETVKHDTSKFFPLHDYLLEQSENAKNSGKGIYKIIDDGKKRDSVTLDQDKFNQLTKQFLECDITVSTNKQFYTESIFLDESTNSYTFNYTTNKNLPVKSIDILVEPASQQVKRIFINKMYTVKDSTVLEKLSWKNNSSFTINKIIQYNNKPLRAHETTVVWGDKN